MVSIFVAVAVAFTIQFPLKKEVFINIYRGRGRPRVDHVSHRGSGRGHDSVYSLDRRRGRGGIQLPHSGVC